MDYGYRTPSVEAFIDSLYLLTVADWERGIRALVRGLPGLDRVSSAATHLIDVTALHNPVVDAQINAAREAAWEAMKQISWWQKNPNMVEGVLKAVSAIVIMDIVPFEKISIAFAPFRFSNACLPISWGSPDA